MKNETLPQMPADRQLSAEDAKIISDNEGYIEDYKSQIEDTRREAFANEKEAEIFKNKFEVSFLRTREEAEGDAPAICFLEGMIDGHKIVLSQQQGFIDGISFTKEQANKLWKVYATVAYAQEESANFINDRKDAIASSLSEINRIKDPNFSKKREELVKSLLDL